MSSNSSPRWWPAILILSIAAIAEICLWIYYSDNILQQVLTTWMVCLGTSAAIGFWWLFFSRLRWRTKFLGLASAVGAGIIFFSLFRYEGLGGDFKPIFSLRFEKTAEQKAADLHAGRPAHPTAQPSVDDAEKLVATPRDWPGFRGANRDGLALREVVRRDWQQHPPEVLWRQSVGPAWSSFALVGDYLFTQEQRGEVEAVVAYDPKTGVEIWAHTNPGRHETFLGGIGPRATPTFHDSHLYALGATGILDCLEPTSGELIWSRNIAQDAGTEQLEFGFSGSPLVVDDLVVVNPGKNVPTGGDPAMYEGSPPGGMIAYHRLTGEIVWKTGSRKAGYGAPRVETLDGERQILVFKAWGLSGHDLATGDELWWWEFTNPYGTNAVQPILTQSGDIFISTETTGSALLDVSRKGQTWTVEPRWVRPNKMRLRFNGGVLQDNHVYGLDGGILSAFNLEDGTRAWKKGRYRFGQILMLKDVLLVLAENGDVALVEVSPQSMTEVARFHAIDGRCWNHPVVRDGYLYVRSDEEMACYDLRPLSAAGSGPGSP